MRSEGEKWREPSVSFRIDQSTYGQGETAARLLLGTRRGDQHLHMGMIQQRAKQRDRGAWKESLQVREIRDWNVMPGAQIVATVAVHAIDANVRVPLLGKVGLDSSIGAIRIAYKYCEIVGENFIESLANELVQTGQLS